MQTTPLAAYVALTLLFMLSGYCGNQIPQFDCDTKQINQDMFTYVCVSAVLI